MVEAYFQMLAWCKEMWRRLAGGMDRPPGAEAGEKGEQAAADFLQKRRGFSLVARNWRNPRDRRDEIDLVCRDGDVVVFVEVKARGAQALVPGYYTVNERKKRVLRRAVHAYLTGLAHPPRTFRFDVVEVALHERLPPQVLHFENVPLFPKGYHVTRAGEI